MWWPFDFLSAARRCDNSRIARVIQCTWLASFRYGESGQPPLRKSLDQSTRAATVRAENLDRAVGVDTIRAAAIRHVFSALGEILQTSLQIVNRYGQRAGDVSGDVLACRPSVENDDPL